MSYLTYDQEIANHLRHQQNTLTPEETWRWQISRTKEKIVARAEKRRAARARRKQQKQAVLRIKYVHHNLTRGV